jgi:hypothetical protein
LIDGEFNEDNLDTVVETFGHCDIDAAKEEAQRLYPRYSVVEARAHVEEGGYTEVLLRERPEYKSFTFVNKKDGQAYTRQISEGAPILDDEALKENDPELYKEITKTETVVIPVEEMTPAQLQKIEDYVYPGKLTVKLGSPRKAKPEELE